MMEKIFDKKISKIITTIEEEINMRIVVYDKFQRKMEGHEKQFLTDLRKLIKDFERNIKIEDSKNDFEFFESNYNNPRGY